MLYCLAFVHLNHINTMKTEYLTSPLVKKHFLRHIEHELTICIGSNAFDNLKASLAHARALLESRRFDSVVYVNIPFSARRFTDTRREVYPRSEKDSSLIVTHMQQGRLGPDFHSVIADVKRVKGKVAVIVNSWEMASSCYRYKEQLLFALHGLVCEYGITVFVYSQAKASSVEPGMIHRSGLGRLAAIAVAVMEIPEEQEEKEVYVEDMLPEKQREGAQLSSQKIKDLRYADGPLKEEEYEHMAVAA
jgi:hypothetical protein